ncbi:hypothetical protein NUU18_04175 [Pediococcus pentosaceus]|uniref:hypothetical protein n=1 Tax=Pediococcus pentosaceus TaxID=1255 RepID=UPI0021E7F214|nr:hypothetical protein [Pediococcus pentosaceus]MCV3325576.1 hypothetical protein [Pediococcus pentosaceus]
MCVIRYLLVHENVPVGAYRTGKQAGYFIITNENERALTLAPLNSHAIEIEERIKAIKAIKI